MKKLIVSNGYKHSMGYLMTTLSQIGLPCKHILVHRFICECIEGQIPPNYQINHIDSNRQNNCIFNLELVTRSENVKHAHEAKNNYFENDYTKLNKIQSIN